MARSRGRTTGLHRAAELRTERRSNKLQFSPACKRRRLALSTPVRIRCPWDISMRRICVFSGSSPGHRPAYREAAATLGGLFARDGIGLVYGGAAVGLMATVADAARTAGGDVIGVIPQSLVEREVAHTGLDDLRVVGCLCTAARSSASLRRVACQFGYRRCGRVARRRQVAEAV